MRTIELNDALIERYAKKIMGFAYSRTRDVWQAEDLSQDILCALASALPRQQAVADLDGFVFAVCRRSWSKFLRGNKRHWNNLDVDLFEQLRSEQDVETQAETALLLERLRAEVAYLSRLHRQITLMFYYDNLTGDVIALQLGIPPSTVRWHLGEIRKKLKEGFKMERQNYKPRRLYCGLDGDAKDLDMRGIGRNPLVDNICIVCYGNALTIEDISRTLTVAAVYIEPLVNDLVSMDYLLKTGRNRYITNFYITTRRFKSAAAAYKLHNIEPCAVKIYNALSDNFDRLLSVGFIGNDLDRDFLMWALMPRILQDAFYSSLTSVLKKHKITIDTPVRPDGSCHWVSAGYTDEPEPEGFSKEELDFVGKANGNGIKNSSYDTGEHSLQYDSYATIKVGRSWREFGSYEDLKGFRRVAHLIRSGETPNDIDKMIIAAFVKDGYAEVIDGRPRLLIPFIEDDKYQKFDAILDDIFVNTIGSDVFAGFIESFAHAIEREIPSFITDDVRTYLRYSAYPQYAVLYWLSDNGYLRYPTGEESRRLCTLVWCDE